MTCTVREATHSDVPRILEMGKRFVAESSYKQHLGNTDAAEPLIQRMVSDPAGTILLSCSGDAITGMLILFFYPQYFSGELIAGEVAWWVEPEARSTRAGLTLLRHAERLARDRGANRIQMIAPTDRIGKLYERLGYEKVEVNYQRKIA